MADSEFMDVPVARLAENRHLAFCGAAPAGQFVISEARAARLLADRNPHGKPNRDVIRPWVGVADIVGAPRRQWIIDFPPDMDEREAALYEQPFEYVCRHARSVLAGTKRAAYRERWWIHGAPHSDMRAVLARRDRFIATPVTARPRVFAWVPSDTLPDHGLIVFVRDDDFFFGVLHSRFHEVWVDRMSGGHRPGNARFRYALKTGFETFPFPWSPTTPLGKLTRLQDEQRTAVAHAARTLDTLRTATSGDKTDSDIPLGALYRARPGWLLNAHAALDEAVAAAYGWPADLADDEIVVRLIGLNRQRSSQR